MTTDIVLIQPPIRDFYLTAKRTFPYGLACIATALQTQGWSVALIDALATAKSRPADPPPTMRYLRDFYGREDRSPFCLFHRYRHYGYSFEQVARLAAASGASLIGISSLFTAYSTEAIDTARAVRAACPGAVIVTGGHHPTALPRAVLDSGVVDFVLRGEGEAGLPQLAAALHGRCALEKVPGLCFRRKNGTLHINPPALVPDPDSFPPPDLRLVKRGFYQRHRRGSVVVTASRGCPMGCSYCALGSDAVPYRRRSVAAVMAEIRTAVDDWGAGFIDFEDENLSLDRRWFADLLARIRRRYGRRLELRAMNGLFPPSLDDDLVGAMQAAGFRALNLSLGTCSEPQQRRFRRPDVRASFETAVSSAHRRGMQAVGYVIAGAPGQRAEESLDDLLYLAYLPVLAAVSVYYPAPGSRDYEHCREKELLPRHFGLMRSSALPIEDTTSRLQAVTLLRLSRLLDFMKQLVGGGQGIPEPRPLEEGALLSADDRTEAGRRLLAAWRYDGRIRGVSPGGRVYGHRVDTRLSHSFLKRLDCGKVRG